MQSVSEQIGLIPLPGNAHEELREAEMNSHDLLDALRLKICDSGPTLLEVR